MKLELSVTDKGAEIANAVQRIAFLRGDVRPGNISEGATYQNEAPSGNAKGLFLSTYVRRGDSWECMFDARRPIMEGPSFDLVPTEYQVIEDSTKRVAVLLAGTHVNPDYTWDVLVEAKENSPWFRFRLTCHLPSDLSISSPEPSVALWMKKEAPEVFVDQGPISIYGGNSWGNSFPAAYLWSEGKEAVVFLNVTPMTWMSRSNLNRFLDCRAGILSRNNETGLGLHAISKSGDTISSGQMVVEYFLYANSRPSKPTALEALDRMIGVCAWLLPANVPFPENRVPPYDTSWKIFAAGVAEDLMRKDICWVDVPCSWKDEPLFPENEVTVLRVHSDYAANSSDDSRLNRPSVLSLWDFATCNNFLAPWIAYSRLHPDEEQNQFLQVKIDNLPLFYDPEANLIRWGAQGAPLTPGLANTMANGIEMSWENFMFHLETMKVHLALPPEHFNPAIPGKFLMACRALIEYAHNVTYIFPQWFDAYYKIPMIQLDHPDLGKVREPFQVGTYAYMMLLGYEMTGEEVYLDEAKKSLEYVIKDMVYTVVNRRYTRTYSSPVDVPIAETFGNGYAVAAAQKIFNLTGDESYLQYAKDYLNILVRMVFWYKDEADAVSRELNNLGLFRPHGGHYGTCPWENIEAYLPLTVFLKHSRQPGQLLLKLFNLQRITSFYYFPPVWTPVVAAANPTLYHHVCQYLPIENFYTLEFGGTHGSMGRCIYMCSIAFWNYLLYEAFAQTDDREIMVMNLDLLDGFEYAINSAERSFIIFNPTAQEKTFTLQMKSLIQGDFDLTIENSSGAMVYEGKRASADLMRGLSLPLGVLGYLRVHLKYHHAEKMKNSIDTIEKARARISHAYQLLQESARDHGVTDLHLKYKKKLILAQNAYDRQAYQEAIDIAETIVHHFLST